MTRRADSAVRLSSRNVFQHRDVEPLAGHDLVQPAILVLEGTEPLWPQFLGGHHL
jgi:hypothetical protein